ncbi:MAG: GNAT family N-acetyltransferase [Rhodothermales bacterium]
MSDSEIRIRNTRPTDFAAIERLTRAVYPNDFPWTADYLAAHLDVFPEGQFVAVDRRTGDVVGMAANFVVRWDEYAGVDSYLDFTNDGFLTNHDPSGKTLYGADVMTDTDRRGEGIGSALYEARKELVRRLGLDRIRGHARLPGYHRYADVLSPEAYVQRIVKGELDDPTLSFQLRHGFRVLDIVPNYFARDPRSGGHAALIEWVPYEGT